MATLTRQDLTETGAVVTFAAAAGGGDVIDNSDGNTILWIDNGSGAPITVTVTPQNTAASNAAWGLLTKTAPALAVTNGTIGSMGPFPKKFNNASGELVITYSGVTSLTVAGTSHKITTP